MTFLLFTTRKCYNLVTLISKFTQMRKNKIEHCLILANIMCYKHEHGLAEQDWYSPFIIINIIQVSMKVNIILWNKTHSCISNVAVSFLIQRHKCLMNLVTGQCIIQKYSILKPLVSFPNHKYKFWWTLQLQQRQLLWQMKHKPCNGKKLRQSRSWKRFYLYIICTTMLFGGWC